LLDTVSARETAATLQNQNVDAAVGVRARQLFGSGLAELGLLGWRRQKRKRAAA
jgi:hypothetical protein